MFLVHIYWEESNLHQLTYISQIKNLNIYSHKMRKLQISSKSDKIGFSKDNFKGELT